MKYLIDTNICIYVIKRRPIEVLQRLQQFKTKDIAISSITTSELYHGIQKSQQIAKNTEALNNFLLPFDIVAYDELASVIYGDIRASWEKQGNIIGPLDLMIAAHALSLNVPVVTNNVKEFERVEGLEVVNWVN